MSMDATIQDAARELAHPGIDLITVADAGGKLAGVVTDSDVVGWVARHPNVVTSSSVQTLMSTKITTCKPSQTLTEVAEMAQKKGEKFTPDQMEAMRDPNSKVKQTIDNIKALKKDLKNLYLPAGKLAALEAELAANLDQLKEKPTAELVRKQMRALEQLKQTLKVLEHARSSLQPTLPRNQEIRSAVLDEPSRQTVPGYEDAVKRYYEMLAVP